MSLWRWGGAVVCLALVGAGVLSQVSSSPTEDHTSLVTNADDGVWTVAAEDMPESGQVGDFTHGILTLENASEADVRLRRVELVDVVGSITLVESYVAPKGRETLYVSSDARFPPADVELSLAPLSGYTIAPLPTGGTVAVSARRYTEGGDGLRR